MTIELASTMSVNALGTGLSQQTTTDYNTAQKDFGRINYRIV